MWFWPDMKSRDRSTYFIWFVLMFVCFTRAPNTYFILSRALSYMLYDRAACTIFIFTEEKSPTYVTTRIYNFLKDKVLSKGALFGQLLLESYKYILEIKKYSLCFSNISWRKKTRKNRFILFLDRTCVCYFKLRPIDILKRDRFWFFCPSWPEHIF